ncbi:MAG: FAD-binding oxidoreductase, partial [Paracoccaceae bacterium]|nr:FAD-binding oxidoreductase [Paracoccaceae bacterium]
MSKLSRTLAARVEGEVLFDRFSRGRYATDASFYQMMPLGVLSPRSEDDIRAALDLAAEQGIPVLPRGGGTSQCGQTVNEALVLDNTQYFNQVLELDVENRRCVVRPGIVLDELNRILK